MRYCIHFASAGAFEAVTLAVPSQRVSVISSAQFAGDLYNVRINTYYITYAQATHFNRGVKSFCIRKVMLQAKTTVSKMFHYF